jgi:hypothetical protein
MYVAALTRVGEGTTGIQIIRVLLEKERRIAIWIMTHLNCMGGVIATNAIDAPDRKSPAPRDGNRCNRRGWYNKISHLGLQDHSRYPVNNPWNFINQSQSIIIFLLITDQCAMDMVYLA